MKLPSLDTAEGIIVLGAGALVAYALYRAYKTGTAIVTEVPATIQAAAASVGNAVQAASAAVTPTSSSEAAANAMLDSDPLSQANVANALQSQTVDYGTGTGWDSTTDTTSIGLGTSTAAGGTLGSDSHTVNTPQQISPSAINQDVGNFYNVTPGGW
jgi:hypothetical protein